MDLVYAPWTVERFIEWDNRQDQKYEFDGVRPVPMTVGSLAHQRIGFNIVALLLATLDPGCFYAIQEMRIRIGGRARYPDVVVIGGPVAQATRTLTDAIVPFEVASDDTAHIDRLDKLNEYATLPSVGHYLIIEQDRVGALVHTREADRWISHAVTEGVIALPAIGTVLPLIDIYAGLTF